MSKLFLNSGGLGFGDLGGLVISENKIGRPVVEELYMILFFSNFFFFFMTFCFIF